jgi:hypothetical protein
MRGQSVRGQTKEEWVRVEFGRERVLGVRIQTGEGIKVSKTRDGVGRGRRGRVCLRNGGYDRLRTGVDRDGDERNRPRDKLGR